jgi:hypothetical protein
VSGEREWREEVERGSGERKWREEEAREEDREEDKKGWSFL